MTEKRLEQTQGQEESVEQAVQNLEQSIDVLKTINPNISWLWWRIHVRFLIVKDWKTGEPWLDIQLNLRKDSQKNSEGQKKDGGQVNISRTLKEKYFLFWKDAIINRITKLFPNIDEEVFSRYIDTIMNYQDNVLKTEADQITNSNNNSVEGIRWNLILAYILKNTWKSEKEVAKTISDDIQNNFSSLIEKFKENKELDENISIEKYNKILAEKWLNMDKYVVLYDWKKKAIIKKETWEKVGVSFDGLAENFIQLYKEDKAFNDNFLKNKEIENIDEMKEAIKNTYKANNTNTIIIWKWKRQKTFKAETLYTTMNKIGKVDLNKNDIILKNWTQVYIFNAETLNIKELEGVTI